MMLVIFSLGFLLGTMFGVFIIALVSGGRDDEQ